MKNVVASLFATCCVLLLWLPGVVHAQQCGTPVSCTQCNYEDPSVPGAPCVGPRMTTYCCANICGNGTVSGFGLGSCCANGCSTPQPVTPPPTRPTCADGMPAARARLASRIVAWDVACNPCEQSQAQDGIKCIPDSTSCINKLSREDGDYCPAGSSGFNEPGIYGVAGTFCCPIYLTNAEKCSVALTPTKAIATVWAPSGWSLNPAGDSACPTAWQEYGAGRCAPRDITKCADGSFCRSGLACQAIGQDTSTPAGPFYCCPQGNGPLEVPVVPAPAQPPANGAPPSPPSGCSSLGATGSETFLLLALLAGAFRRTS